MKTNPPWINRLRERRDGREALEKWRKEEAEKRTKERAIEAAKRKAQGKSYRSPYGIGIAVAGMAMAMMSQGRKLK